MFVDVDESLKREREKYLLEIRRQTRKHKYDYTRVFSAERMNGLANRENYRANPMFSWKPEFRV